MPIHRIESGVAPAKSKLIHLTRYDTDNVGALSNVTQTFTPPVGHIWKIAGLALHAYGPTGATVGTHAFSIQLDTTIITKGISVFGSELVWNYSHWFIADSSKLPAESETALMAILNTIFFNTVPLKIKYFNTTDAIASSTRTFNIDILETPIT